MSRPEDYRPEFVGAAKKLCELGATDRDLGEAFGVSARTIQNWRLRHLDFAEACRIGKGFADDIVERRMYERAIGYDAVEEQAVKLAQGAGKERKEEVVIVKLEKHVPADAQTGMWWLVNRRGGKWKNRTERHVSGTIDHNVTTPDDARDVIRKYKAGERDGPPTEH